MTENKFGMIAEQGDLGLGFDEIPLQETQKLEQNKKEQKVEVQKG